MHDMARLYAGLLLLFVFNFTRQRFLSVVIFVISVYHIAFRQFIY